VHTKFSRVQGASGTLVGTVSFGKLEGHASARTIAFMLHAAEGPYYHQTWEGVKETTPIISGGMTGPLRRRRAPQLLASPYPGLAAGMLAPAPPQRARPRAHHGAPRAQGPGQLRQAGGALGSS